MTDTAERLEYTSAVINGTVGLSKESTKQGASKLIDLLDHDCSMKEAG